MMFKKPKELVLEEIQGRVGGQVFSTLNNYQYNGHLDLNQLKYAIEQSITRGVTEAFRTMIENVYTDAEFEEDISLR